MSCVAVSPVCAQLLETQELEWQPIVLSPPAVSPIAGNLIEQEAPRPETPPPSDLLIQLLKECDQFMAQGDYVQAAARLNEAQAMVPDNTFLLLKSAQLNALRRRYYFAEDELLVLSAQQPENAEVFTLLGGVSMRLGKKKKAALALDKALDLDPTNLAARFNRACLDLIHGDKVVAQSRLKKLTIEEYGRCMAWLALERDVLPDLLGTAHWRTLAEIILTGGYRVQPGSSPLFLDHLEPMVWGERFGAIALTLRGYLDAAAQTNQAAALSAIADAQTLGALSPALDAETQRWTGNPPTQNKSR